MTIKLSDTQLILLSGAARRKDRCLAPPKGFKSAAALKAVERLLQADYVTEVKGKKGVAIWHRDEIAEQDYCLKLTPSGLRAIAADSDDDEKPTARARPDADTTPDVAPAPMVAAKAQRTPPPLHPPAAPLNPRAPRPGTKISRVISLLSREGGTTLVEIVASTDWLPHTARAALTGLRKRGYAVERRAREEAGGSYFIAAETKATFDTASSGAA